VKSRRQSDQPKHEARLVTRRRSFRSSARIWKGITVAATRSAPGRSLRARMLRRRARGAETHAAKARSPTRSVVFRARRQRVVVESWTSSMWLAVFCLLWAACSRSDGRENRMEPADAGGQLIEREVRRRRSPRLISEPGRRSGRPLLSHRTGDEHRSLLGGEVEQASHKPNDNQNRGQQAV